MKSSPHPASDYIQIEVTNATANNNLTLYNSIGEIKATIKLTPGINTIPTNEFLTGNYFARYMDKTIQFIILNDHR